MGACETLLHDWNHDARHKGNDEDRENPDNHFVRDAVFTVSELHLIGFGSRAIATAMRPCYNFGKSLVNEAVFQDTHDGADAVFPSDLFTFVVRTAIVGDGDFIDHPVLLGDFRGDFRLKAKAVFFNFNLLQHLFFEDPVADLHIGEIEVGHHVRQGGEKAIAEVVPVVDERVVLVDGGYLVRVQRGREAGQDGGKSE